MMHSKSFILAVKVNGKILRESGDQVSIPTSTEYSVFLKNLLSRRAQVKVWVDGKDITEGTRLILGANESLDLDRYIRDGNLKSGNRLKFIERTAGIENHRGIGGEDGIIRAEFWAERETVEVPHFYAKPVPLVPRYENSSYPYPKLPDWSLGNGIIYGNNSDYSGGNIGSHVNTSTTTTSSLNNEFTKSGRITRPSSFGEKRGTTKSGKPPMKSSLRNSSVIRSCSMKSEYTEASPSAEVAGITVPGSRSDQEFVSSSGFALESSSTVITLQLKGIVGGIPVTKPVTVEVKPLCTSCGRKNKATSKFCVECGTALVLL
jgi:hypothetical protein